MFEVFDSTGMSPVITMVRMSPFVGADAVEAVEGVYGNGVSCCCFYDQNAKGGKVRRGLMARKESRCPVVFGSFVIPFLR